MPTEQEIHNMFIPNIENSMRDVRMARMLFITKNGKLHAGIAEQYIDKMSYYVSFCREDAKTWSEDLRTMVYCTGHEEVNDSDVEGFLKAFELAGQIMEANSKGVSRLKIRKILESQNIDDESLKNLSVVLDRYAEYGLPAEVFTIGDALIKTLKAKKDKEKQEKQS
ncbi:MAG: hypothetical protein IKP98_01125 [Bacilli bacterium]|nr:hypothetical protein [Bacilli bacterium]